MDGGSSTLDIQVGVAAGEGDHELAEATSRLQRELLELDVESVEPASGGESPSGVRAVDIVALGTLIVTLAKSEVLAAIVSAVRSWLGGQRGRSVKLEVDGDVLELAGVSSAEQRRLSDEWLRRHARIERSVDAAEVVRATYARSALIVASYDYQDPGLRRLRAPAHDAEALARVLQDPQIGGFEVRSMLNEPAHVINEGVEDFFADRSLDDLLLLHFSCHGLKDEGGELYFAAANTKLRRLGATAVAADFVNRRMSRSRSQRVVLLLDCCYAGAFERGMTARAGSGVGIDEHFGGRGRAVITASSAMEYAFEGDSLADTQVGGPSVFTKALVEGLETGDADRDQDGYVALDELYDYVYDQVREATPNQTPGKWTFAVQGDLYIARRSRPVTTPAPLPPELQQAVDHPLAKIRVGAVEELERLLGTRHAGLALAAKLTLEHLTNDDSRMVSAAATAALSAQPGPEAETPSAREAPTTEPKRASMPAEPQPGTTAAVPTTLASGMEEQPTAPSPPTIVTPTSKHGIGPRQDQGPALPMATGTPPAQGVGVRDVERSTGAAAHADRQLRVAGGMGIVGAALLLLSLFPTYVTNDISLDFAFGGGIFYAIIMASLVLIASILTVRLRMNSLRGPGLLLGAGASASVRMLENPLHDYYIGADDVGIGYWLDIVAHVFVVFAACVAALSLTRSGDVRFRLHRPDHVTPRLIVFLGLVGGGAFFYQFVDILQFDDFARSVPFFRVALIWGTVLVVAVPMFATMATPRRFGVALLAGWIWGAAALVVNYYLFIEDVLPYAGTSFLLVFAGTLLVLLFTIIPFSRGSGPAIRARSDGLGSSIGDLSR
jgi:hypothetical protein